MYEQRLNGAQLINTLYAIERSETLLYNMAGERGLTEDMLEMIRAHSSATQAIRELLPEGWDFLEEEPGDHN